MSASSISPIPQPSTPTLLAIVCSPVTFRRTSAAIRFSGTPHIPKPPTMMLEPSAISATAASEFATTLFTGHQYSDGYGQADADKKRAGSFHGTPLWALLYRTFR